MDLIAAIKQRFEALAPHLNERTRRLVAAGEAKAYGWGGGVAVSRATGVSRRAIREGTKELADPAPLAPERVRRPGGGRKRIDATDPGLRDALERLVEPTTRGDPESPLRWTCKSVRNLAEELQRQGHQVSHQTVGKLLRDLGYSLQANPSMPQDKVLEGKQHPDRDAQFEHLNRQVQAQVEIGRAHV